MKELTEEKIEGYLKRDPILNEFKSFLENKDMTRWSIKLYLRSIIKMKEEIKKPYTEITKRDFNIFYEEMKKRYNNRESRKRHITAMRQFFKWLRDEKELIQRIPVSDSIRFKKVVRLPKILTEEESAEIIKMITKEKVAFETETQKLKRMRDIAMFTTLYSSGMRLSELLALKPNNINWKDCSIRIEDAKRNKDREPFISEKARYYLKKYIELKGIGEDDLIFKVDPATVRNRLRYYSEKAGINKRIFPHLFRHTILTRMIEWGLNPYEVKKISGHESLDSLSSYIHLAKSKMKPRFMEFYGKFKGEDLRPSYVKGINR